MKTILTTFLLFFICTFSNAQIFGSNDVCSGYTYIYTATIPGAVTYSWSFPPGWYDLSGQGTGSVTVTCNENIGDIYCEGIDAGGNSITTLVLVTQFGGGSGSGWDVQPSSVSGCNGMLFTVSVVPNGTGSGSCPAGCGNGTLHSNIHYALYSNTWPLGTFINFADGVSLITMGLNVSTGPTYVYQVDVTNGYDPPQAVQISGGCGGGTVNNVCMITLFMPILPTFSQTPSAPCIGDTVRLYETSGIGNPCWGCLSSISGLTIIGSAWTNPLTAIVTNSSPTADVTGIGINGCITYDIYNVNTGTCVVGSVTGDTTLCSGYTYNYAASIPSAVTYNWSFPIGWYNITGQGTSNVSATCNVNDGNICVEGFDGSGNSVGTVCITTQFGGGGAVGWDVQPQNSTTCSGNPYSLTIVPNSSGSGSCPNGCGNGIAVSNIGFGVYDNMWPNGNFIGFADGSVLSVPIFPGNFTYYIYIIDYTNGTSTTQAVRIEGGCGAATVNNVAQLTIPVPILPGFSQMPDPVCIGDTVSVWEASGFTNPAYTPIMGITLLNQAAGYMTAVVNSIPARASYTAFDWNGCFTSGICYINAVGCNASLTGDSVVCAGYVYNYSVNIPGAVTYNWTLPAGWYDISGQGTANISATCNVNDGWVSVIAYDAIGNIIGAEDLETHFGAGSGWNVSSSGASGCWNDYYFVSVTTNGTGGGAGCASGCGNGTPHANLAYVIYSDVWGSPTCLNAGVADNFTPIGFTTGTYYVYHVDITNGYDPPQAIMIEGGCGNAIINNTYSVSVVNINPSFTQMPDPACLGDTVVVTDNSGSFNYYLWHNISNVTLIDSNQNIATFVINGANPTVDLTTGCGYGQYTISVIPCTIPSVSFQSSDTVFCDKQSVNFTDLSTNNPTSWQWLFSGAIPDTSNAQNPQNIYYPANGTFDVTLIACNAGGCDTLFIPGFIVEYQSPSDTIIQSTDTLYSLPSNSYQWYEVTGGLIAGATLQYYVPTQTGNYYCIITDSNGCLGVSNTISVIITALPLYENASQITVTPNPNSGTFLIEFHSLSQIINLKTEIINSLGEIIFEKDFENVNGKFSQQINLSDNAKGIYILKVTGDKEVFMKKIIIH